MINFSLQYNAWYFWWSIRITQFCCSVRLIASVPGRHTGLNKTKWGHLKLRKVMFSFHWPFSTFARGEWFLTRPKSSLFLRTERDQRERGGWWEGGASVVNKELKQRQRWRQRERQKDFLQPARIWFLTFGLWVVKRATPLFSFAAMLQNKLHVFAARFTVRCVL